MSLFSRKTSFNVLLLTVNLILLTIIGRVVIADESTNAILEGSTYLYYYESDDQILEIEESHTYTFAPVPGEDITIVTYGLDETAVGSISLYDSSGNLVSSATSNQITETPATLPEGETPPSPFIVGLQHTARSGGLYYFEVKNESQNTGFIRTMLFVGEPFSQDITLIDKLNPLLPSKAFMVAGDPDREWINELTGETIQGLRTEVDVLPVERIDRAPEVFASNSTLTDLPPVGERLIPSTVHRWFNQDDEEVYLINIRPIPEMETDTNRAILDNLSYDTYNSNNFFFFEYLFSVGNGSDPIALDRGAGACAGLADRIDCISSDPNLGREETTAAIIPGAVSDTAASVAPGTFVISGEQITVSNTGIPCTSFYGGGTLFDIGITNASGTSTVCVPSRYTNNITNTSITGSYIDPVTLIEYNDCQGTVNPDLIACTTGDDYVDALTGDDAIFTDAGNDYILAGPGIDFVVAGAGDDFVDGGDDNDGISGGEGEDTLLGGAGSDRIEGDGGDDAIDGGDDQDFILGGAGNDSISGSGGNDIIFGNAGNDIINGGESIYNGSGDRINDVVDLTPPGDALAAGIDPANQIIWGGTGADTFIIDDSYNNGTDFSWTFIAGNESSDSTSIADGERDVFFFEGNPWSGGYVDIFVDNADVLSFVSASVGISVNVNSNNFSTIEGGSSYVYGAPAGNISGSEFADIFTLTGCSTSTCPSYNVEGNGGDDIITTGASNDTIDGGADNDTITTSGGTNTLNGGDGTDTINGGTGVDTINGGADDDTINGNGGDDILNGDGGDDTITGGAGDDTVDGGADTDTFDESASTSALNVVLNTGSGTSTGNGTDTLVNIENVSGSALGDTFTNNDAGDNIIDGNGGFDIATVNSVATTDSTITITRTGTTVTVSDNVSGVGNDTYLEVERVNVNGTDNDEVFAINDDQVNFLDGLGGTDTIDYSANANDITVTFYDTNTASVVGVGIGTDIITNFENYSTGSGSDLFIFNADAGTVTLDADGNDDTFDFNNGAAGDITLVDQSGNTFLDFSDYDDGVDLDLSSTASQVASASDTSLMLTLSGTFNTVSGSANADNITGTTGADTISGRAGADTIFGNDGADTLYGNAGIDTIDGGEGDDTIDGGIGNDTIYGGDGLDTISGSNGNDTIFGGADADNITGDAGADTIDGGTGGDTIDGGTGNDTILGNDGVDFITGGTGADTIDGGADVDTIDGGEGADTIDGGAGADIINGGNGADTLTGGEGADTLDGDAGVDTVDESANDNGVVVTLTTGGNGTIFDTVSLTTDTLIEIENVTTGGGDDVFHTSDSGDNIFDAGAGTDELTVSTNAIVDDTVTITRTGTNVVLTTVAGNIGNDEYRNFELLNVSGGIADDYFILADAENNEINGLTNISGDTVDVTSQSSTDDLITIVRDTGTGDVTVSGTGFGTDTYINIEQVDVTGGSGDETIELTDSGDNIIDGGGSTTTDTITVFTEDTTGSGEDISIRRDTVTGIVSVSNTAGTSVGNDTYININQVNISGSSGDDNFTIFDEFNNIINGASGTDTVTYTDVDVSLFVDSSALPARFEISGTGIGTDLLISIENINTGDGDDTFIVQDANNNDIDGGGGDDVATVLMDGLFSGIITIDRVPSNVVTVIGSGYGTDTYTNIEQVNVTSSDGDDVFRPDDSNVNIFDAGAGTDWIDYSTISDTTAAVSVNLAAGTGLGDGSNTDTLLNFENITGTGNSDSLIGDGNDNIISGGLGSDFINGGTGTDTFRENTTSDDLTVTLSSGSGNSTGQGADVDTLFGIENVTTGSGADTINLTDSAVNIVDANGGNDTVNVTNATTTSTLTVTRTGTDVALTDGGTGFGNDQYLDVEQVNINGGSGVDNFTIDDTSDNDIDGNGGIDIVDYSAAANTITVTFDTTTTAVGTDLGTDTLTEIEDIRTGTGDDTFIFNTNVLVAVDGNTGIQTYDFDAVTGDITITDAGTTFLDFRDYIDVVDVDLSISTTQALNGNLNLTLDGTFTSISGSDQADTIAGTDSVDIIYGGASADDVRGNDGDDFIYGEDGADTLRGNMGDDTIYGGAGADLINGGNDNDTLYGGDDGDTINGGGGLDTIFGDAGADLINGGSGVDTIDGGDDADTINGGEGADIISGGDGNDTLDGDEGNDILDGGAGTDTVDESDNDNAQLVTLADGGLSGSMVDTFSGETDTLIDIENVSTGGGDDYYTINDSDDNILDANGGSNDIAVVNSQATGVSTINITRTGVNVVVDGTGIGTDQYLDFEFVNVSGGTGDDTFIVSDSTNNEFNGLAGTDSIDYSSDGSDLTADFNNLNTVEVSGGSFGTDTLINFEEITTGIGADSFLFNADVGTMTINSGDGNDTFDFNASAAGTLTLNTAGVTETGLDFADFTEPITIDLSLTTAQTVTSTLDITLGGLFTSITGTTGNDVLAGSINDDTIIGGDGNDTLSGNAGDDTLNGGNGIDTIDESADNNAKIVILNTAPTDGRIEDTVNGEIDTLIDIENVSTGGGDDYYVINDSADNILNANGGSNDIGIVNSQASGTITINRSGATTTVVGTGIGTDSFINFESVNVSGSAFADTFVITDTGNNVLNGLGGTDTIDYSSDGGNLTADFSSTNTVVITGGSIGNDTLINFEDLTTGAGNDTFLFNADVGDIAITAGAGDNTFDFNAGADGTLTLSTTTESGLDFEDYAGPISINLSSTSQQTVNGSLLITLDGLFTSITGSSGADTIIGTSQADILNGSAGADNIDGGAGDDILIGGIGDDILNGGAGTDTIDESGNDNAKIVTLNTAPTAGSIVDTVSGTTDTLIDIENVSTGGGDDYYTINDSANNTLDANGGTNDIAIVNSQATGTSTITITRTTDTIVSGAGIGLDTFIDFETVNVSGSAFADTFIVSDTGDNVLNGLGGTDSIDYTSDGGDLTADFSSANTVDITGGSLGTDTLINFEDITTGGGNDTFLFNADVGTVTINSEAGNNYFDFNLGAAGVLTLNTSTDSGLDFADFTSGITIDLSSATQQTVATGLDVTLGGNFTSITDTAFSDIITGTDSNDVLVATGGDDTLNGGLGNDTLSGGIGNDTLDGGVGSDTVDYSADLTAPDSITATLNADTITVETTALGTDTLIAIENVIAGEGDDTFIIQGLNTDIHNLDGNLGNDTFFFDGIVQGDIGLIAGGTAHLDFGTFTSTGITIDLSNAVTQTIDTLLDIQLTGTFTSISGSTGADTISGTDSADTIWAGTGNDIISGGLGADTIYGEGGTDTFREDTSTNDLTVILTDGDGTSTGEGADTLFGIENVTTGSGADNFTLDDGNVNIIDANGGTDTVTILNAISVTVSRPGGGSDVFITDHATGVGNDEYYDVEQVNISGTAGDDTFVMADALINIVNGNAGIDTVDYSTVGAVTTVNIISTATSATVTGEVQDTLLNIENINTGGEDDVFVIEQNAIDNTLNANGGTDSATYQLSSQTTISATITTSGSTQTITYDDGEVDVLQNFESISFSGDGDDETFIINDAGDTGIDGNGGTDTYDISSFSNSDTAVNAAGDITVTNSDVGTDTLVEIEEVITGDGDDTFTIDTDIDGIYFFNANGDNILGNIFAFTGGGAGNITIEITADEFATDELDFSQLTTGVGVNIDLSNTAQQSDILTGSATGNLSITLNNFIDNVVGTDEADNITGNDLDNNIDAGDGDDIINYSAGDDTIDAGLGTDTVNYAGAPDAISATLSSTQILVDVSGTTDTDTITNAEVISGTANDDTFNISEAVSATIDGEGGVDTIDYSGLGDAITVDLEVGTGNVSGTSSSDDHTLSDIENVIGSNFDDTIIGNDDDNFIQGNSGDDTIRGNDGSDTILGDDNDSGTADGNDKIDGGEDDDDIDGNGGDDTIHGGGGSDNISGSEGNDLIFGDFVSGTATSNTSGSDTIVGGAGDDTIYGGSENDAAVDTFGWDDNGSDVIYGDDGTFANTGGGNDIIYGGNLNTGALTNTGEDNNDTIYGESGDDIIYGGNNNESGGSGGDGDDTIYGNTGSDTIYGGNNNSNAGTEDRNDDGDDIITGDNDTNVVGITAEDTIYGGNNNSSSSGSDGTDGDDTIIDVDQEDEGDTIYGGNNNSNNDNSTGSSERADDTGAGATGDTITITDGSGGNDVDTVFTDNNNDGGTGDDGGETDTVSGEGGEDTVTQGNCTTTCP